MATAPRGAGRAAIVDLLVAVAVAVAVVVAPALPARAAEPVTYRPPVDAPITDPYRPPTTPYGPGNRGIEYGTAPGTVVRAAADGTVSFAGAVAGARYVTVRHRDGLRTTVGPLGEIRVAIGQRVALGEPVGTAAGRVLLTVRRGAAYLDPAAVLAHGPGAVHLVSGSSPSAARRHHAPW